MTLCLSKDLMALSPVACTGQLFLINEFLIFEVNISLSGKEEVHLQ